MKSSGMARGLIVWLMLIVGAMAAPSVAPVQEVTTKGAVKDMVLAGDRLVIGTGQSLLQVYDYVQKRFVKEIRIPDIKDFMGDTIPAHVSSVDYLEGRYLLLSDSGKGGYSDLRIHENNVTKRILGATDRKAVIKARFIDRDHVLLGYLSDEVSLLDLRTKKELYLKQLNESKFSDFALNADRSLAAFSCESGEITVIETRTGKILKKLSGQNVDNVFKVDIKKEYVVGGGKDRRASWYNWKTGEGGYFQASFIVYAAALSPSAERAAYAMDENDELSVYHLGLGSKIATLTGQNSTINTIIFKDDHTVFASSDGKRITIWKIK